MFKNTMRLLALSLAVTLAELGIRGPKGEPGPPGDDWNDGLGGDRGCYGPKGKPRPQLNRPYLKQKKGRNNAHHPANRPKGYTR